MGSTTRVALDKPTWSDAAPWNILYMSPTPDTFHLETSNIDPILGLFLEICQPDTSPLVSGEYDLQHLISSVGKRINIYITPPHRPVKHSTKHISIEDIVAVEHNVHSRDLRYIIPN